jgi:glucose-6-phosphate isomerase
MPDDSTIERLTRLETKVHLKFEELDRALVLAAANVEKEKILARDQTRLHFDEVNQFQKRMDKMAAMFATREWVIDKLEQVNKLIYIGVGLAIAIGFVLKFVFKTW